MTSDLGGEGQISLPYVKGSDTSKEAAERLEAKPQKIREQHQRILGYLATRGEEGATDPEIQAALVMGGSTERPRRVELQRMSLIVKTGQRRNGCAVWRVRG